MLMLSKFHYHESSLIFLLQSPPGFSRQQGPPGFSKPVKVTSRYQEPENFSTRNQALLTLATQLLGGKSLEFAQFKKVSSEFRKGDMSTREYYERCTDIIAEENFAKIFPELVVLLPDIEKQNVSEPS